MNPVKIIDDSNDICEVRVTDGRLVDVYALTLMSYRPAQARELARALMAGADELDGIEQQATVAVPVDLLRLATDPAIMHVTHAQALRELRALLPAPACGAVLDFGDNGRRTTHVCLGSQGHEGRHASESATWTDNAWSTEP